MSNLPINKNFLSPNNFKFFIKKAPHLNYFVQSASIPGFALGGPPEYQNPFVNIPIPGDRLFFEPLQISFKVDEDFMNYLEIHDWLFGLGFPDDFDQYKELSDRGTQLGTGEGVYSDLSLVILSSAKNPNMEITFLNAFPVGLTSLTFDTTNNDVNHLTATASFRYMRFGIKRIT